MGNVIRVIWNQECPAISNDTWQVYNSSFTSATFDDGICTQTYLRSARGYNVSLRHIDATLTPCRIGDIIYCSYEIYPESDSTWSAELGGGLVDYTPVAAIANNWTRIAVQGIAIKTGNYRPLVANRRSTDAVVGTVIKMRNAISVNLTNMFGAGNEPNLKEFEAQCALNGIDLTQYQIYDAGTERDWILPNYNNEMMERKKQILIASPHIIQVTTGNTTDSSSIAHFKTNIPAKIKSLKTYFSPIQEGTGTPSLNNVRAITGWTSFELTKCGINLLQCDTFTNGSSNGINYTGVKNNANEIELITISGTKLYTNCFRNLNYTPNKKKWPPNGNFATYGYSSQANVVFVGDNSSIKIDNYWPAADEIVRWQNYNNFTTNSANTTEWVRIQIVPYSTTNISINDSVKPLVCLASDQGCEFEPYNGETITTTFPTEIYGGIFDLISGILTVTCLRIVMTGTYISNQGTGFRQKSSATNNVQFYSALIGAQDTRNIDFRLNEVTCNKCPVILKTVNTTVNQPTLILYNYSETLMEPRIAFPLGTDISTVAQANAWLAEQYDAGEPIVYTVPLATPVIYYLTPQTLKTLRGVNNIWSNTNGKTEITYWTN